MQRSDKVRRKLPPYARHCVRSGVVCGHRRYASRAGVGSANMCFYLMDTGNQRDCEPGDGCFYFTTEKCKEKPFDWAEIKED